MSGSRDGQRQLAAVLAADVVGFSAQMARSQGATISAIGNLRREILEPGIEASGGTVIKRMGDGWLAHFPSVSAAANCALTVQQALQGDGGLELRIGIHLGEITRQDGEFFGDGINIAARLEPLAESGGIVLSGDAYRQLPGEFPVTFFDSGQRTLKNIPTPITLWSWPSQVSGPEQWDERKSTLFISPFDGGPEASDLSESLAATLDRQTGLQLQSDAAKARYHLTGTLRSAGTRWRLTLHLSDQFNGADVWRGRFEEEGSDPFAAIDRFVDRASAEFRYKVQAHEAKDLESVDQAQMSVEQLLNFASGFYQSPDEQSWRGAIVPLRRALELDPGNFMAQAMMAASLLTGLSIGWRQDAAEDIEEADALSAQAISVAPHSDFTVFSRGYVAFKRGNIDEARRLGERALEISESYSNAIYLVSLAASMAEDVTYARSMADAALRTGKQHPMRHIYEVASGYADFVGGDLASAAEAFRRASHLAPLSGQAGLGLVFTLEMLGDSEQAKENARRFVETFDGFEVEKIAIMPFANKARLADVKDAFRSAFSRVI